MKDLHRFNSKLPSVETILQKGIYQHYKGKQYEVVGVARHSETLEEVVVYRALYGEFGLWVRPIEMFLEYVEVTGTQRPRFKLLSLK